jgi:hypothetical protein
MSDVLRAVWQRLDRDPSQFFEDELGCGPGTMRDQLVEPGYLAKTTASGFAACPGCNLGFVGRVEWLTNSRTGARTAYIPCPECGAVEVDPNSLRQWTVSVPTLLTAVFAAAGGRGTPTAIVEGHVWRLGHAPWGGHHREAYFVRCVHERSRAGVVDALATHPRAVLFFPTEIAAHRWGPTTPNPVVALESVVGFGPDGLTFDAAIVADRLADVFAETPDEEPVPKRASRTANIARLTEAVIEHLRCARAHAFATLELSQENEAELLPRPSKKQLGELVGLEPYEVTRCFDDETARELHLYWKTALDLDAVMKFSGPISTGPNA